MLAIILGIHPSLLALPSLTEIFNQAVKSRSVILGIARIRSIVQTIQLAIKYYKNQAAAMLQSQELQATLRPTRGKTR